MCNACRKIRGAARTSPSSRRVARESAALAGCFPSQGPLAVAGHRAASRAGLGRPRGFTLLEILVVVLIIGVVTAGMLLSMSFAGKDTDLETESKRLLSLMDYAREQSELQTRNYGVL